MRYSSTEESLRCWGLSVLYGSCWDVATRKIDFLYYVGLISSWSGFRIDPKSEIRLKKTRLDRISDLTNHIFSDQIIFPIFKAYKFESDQISDLDFSNKFWIGSDFRCTLFLKFGIRLDSRLVSYPKYLDEIGLQSF